MKTIPNKQFDGDNSVAAMAKHCTRTAPESNSQGGISVDIMRKRIRVIDAIELAEKNKASIQLEDADYDELKQCVKDSRWGAVDKMIIEFHDIIMNAEKGGGPNDKS